MGEQADPKGVQTLERVCEPVTVTVSDTAEGNGYVSSRTITVRFGACYVGDLLAVISAASAAARANGGEGA